MKLFDMKPHELLGLPNYANTSDDIVKEKYMNKKRTLEEMRQGEINKSNGNPLDDRIQEEYNKLFEHLDNAYEQLKTEELRRQYFEREKEEENMRLKEERVSEQKVGQVDEQRFGQVNSRTHRNNIVQPKQNSSMQRVNRVQEENKTTESPKKELDYPEIRGRSIIWKSSLDSKKDEMER